MFARFLNRLGGSALMVGLVCTAVVGVADAAPRQAPPAVRPGSAAAPSRRSPLVLRRAVFPDVAARPAIPASTLHAIRPVTGSVNGVSMLRALGARAGQTLAPATGLVGALVALPDGTRAEDFGLGPVAPGIGRLRARPEQIEAFAEKHPDLRLEVAPPLQPLMDRAREVVGATRARGERGMTGSGVFVGVADTGLDVTHHEFRHANGKSRVRWMLDLSLAPTGRHPELEARFGVKGDDGRVTGAVFSNDDIDELLAAVDSGACVESLANQNPDGTPKGCAPTDEMGHGTHVTGIAAGSGDLGPPVFDANGVAQPLIYGGVAPTADIVFVRVTRGAFSGIENDDFVRAIEFMFDRADAEHKPLVANVSLGSDFGPHDGTLLWEKAIASFVGPDKPGHAIVAAAGNSGSISDARIHQSVRVQEGTTMRVPITTYAESGAVQVWITLRGNANMRIGLESPEGVWIPPIEEGTQRGKNAKTFDAGVIYGATARKSPVPSDSRGAVVVWTGNQWPSGTYYVTLEGTGTAELYLQGIDGAKTASFFTHGVREGTVNLPATHPSIIGVGCTANRQMWTSIAGEEQGMSVPFLDEAGWLPLGAGDVARGVVDGEVCWFSGAGPTATGVPKPEIAAPGALVVSAMSRNATPESGSGMFLGGCFSASADGIPRCRQIDTTHGVASGTSMSSPVVTGVVALLLSREPTLTQDKIVAVLQAGAHQFRGPHPFDDQSGPGEVDVMGSLDVLEQMRNPELVLPEVAQSWITLSSSYVAADGSRPISAIVELRTSSGNRAADLFDQRRLSALLIVDGKTVTPPPELRRRGPGVYVFEWTAPPGLGSKLATFGATFDGALVVPPKTVPIGTDGWTAFYPSSALGSACSAGVPQHRDALSNLFVAGTFAVTVVALGARRRRRGREAAPRRLD